jgi:hypothetical protein
MILWRMRRMREPIGCGCGLFLFFMALAIYYSMPRILDILEKLVDKL